MISKELREFIVSWLREGRKVSEIVSLVKDKCQKCTVYSIASELKKEPSKKAKQRKKYPPRKVTPNMVRRMVRLLTFSKAHHSFRSVAKLLQLNEKTVRRHMEGREITCFEKIKRNHILQAQKETRQKCAMNLRKTFLKSDVSNMMFVDECYICVGKYFNHQNERCYGYFLEMVRDEKKFKQFPKTALCAMLFGGVSRGGRSPLIVLKSGFRLNQQTYKDECLIALLENLPHDLYPATVILYQDKAPCHATKSVQQFLEEAAPRFVCNEDIPPNSHDLNVLDYCVWSQLKERVKQQEFIFSFDKLAGILKKERDSIPQKMIQDSVDSWLIRVRKVEEVGDGHIE